MFDKKIQMDYYFKVKVGRTFYYINAWGKSESECFGRLLFCNFGAAEERKDSWEDIPKKDRKKYLMNKYGKRIERITYEHWKENYREEETFD